MAKNIIKAINEINFDTEDFSGPMIYDLVGVLPEACSIVRFINTSGTQIIISYDGENAHDFVAAYPAASSFLTLNFQTNNIPQSNMALLPKGTTIYAQGTPGVGTFHVVGYYTPQS